MGRRLHITNGDSAVELIRLAGFDGMVVPWRDVLHEGPVPEHLSLRELSLVRAEFLASSGCAELEDARQQLGERDAILHHLGAFDEVVLWFEHDLYDQLQLLQVLDAVAARPSTSASLICGEEYLGRSAPERLVERFADRESVSDAALMLAQEAWAAFRSSVPRSVVTVLDGDTSPLPYLVHALQRHLLQFPSAKNGLSRSEELIVVALATETKSLKEVFKYQAAAESAEFLGDAIFAIYAKGLSNVSDPLIQFEDGTSVDGDDSQPEFWNRVVELTDAGKAVLNGERDHIELNGIDRWLGGVHLTPETLWRWDEEGAMLTYATEEG